MSLISALPVPLLIVFVLVYGLIKKVDIYDAFVEGAARAIPTLVRVAPYICAMTMAIALLRDSGLLDALSNLLSPALSKVGMNAELLPLALLKPLSGSGSLAMVNDIMTKYGPDSFQARAAAVMCGSSETILYTIALYFGAVKIKRTRYTLPVALCATIFAVFFSLFITRVWYNA
jgi:spore maturation protein B